MNVCSYFSKRHGRYFMLFAGAALALGISGCIQNYGKFSRDSQVSQAFRNGLVQPEFNYFYAGRETVPYAIMGIDTGYAISSSLWTAFEPQPEQLRKMSSNIYGKQQYDPYGFNILDPDGAIIGIWFSSLHFPSVKIDEENRTVHVQYKNPESYRNH